MLRAGTLCVHGDHPDAALRARRLHAALAGAGVVIAANGSAA
jgi:lactam utilization protein B